MKTKSKGKSNRSQISLFYWILATLRLALVCIPQLGYIHPDEYFQSIEVLCGNIFGFEAQLPWEFNSTFPIRSMAIPYFTTGMNYKFLQAIDYLVKEYLGATIITPYFLLVFPRLLMCLASFIVDYVIYKICITNNEKFSSKLIVLATSYIMIVYATRTFSNTIELVLYAMLLYYVAESIIFSNVLIKSKEYISYRYEKAQSVAERAKFHKLKLFLVSDSLRNCIQISTIVTLGFFNRPTFLAFAVIPVFFWLYRGIGRKTVLSLNFHLRMLALILCSIPTLILVVIIDSFYYGYLTWGEIGMLEISIDNFVFTPLNFLKYNMNTNNLAEHGLHPRYLNIAVNIPLLFNVLALFYYSEIVQNFYRCSRRKYNFLPSVRSIKGLMTFSILAPVCLLSCFPHQEPRFLIPLIVPLVYLHSSKILPEPETELIKAEKHDAIKPELLNTQRSSHTIFKIWLAINVILTFFYGFLHQGGIFPAVSNLSKKVNSENPVIHHHIFTSHIYSIPGTFFLQKDSTALYATGGKKYSVEKRVFFHEEQSKDLPLVLNKILTEKSSYKNNKKPVKLYLLIPSSLGDSLMYLSFNGSLSFKELETFYPHISTEMMPDVTQYCLDIYPLKSCDPKNTFSMVQYLLKIFKLFGLKMYEIK